jgi:hemerythrin-like domain-containing protein
MLLEEYRMPRSTDALELLRRDHEELNRLFRQAVRADDREKQQLAREIVERLRTHARVEGTVFYPFLRETTGRDDVFEEAGIEHEVALRIVEELDGDGLDSPRFDALLNVLAEYVELHMKEEEDVIFPLARKTGIDLEALGVEMLEQRERGDPGRERGKRAAPGGDGPRKADEQ